MPRTTLPRLTLPRASITAALALTPLALVGLAPATGAAPRPVRATVAAAPAAAPARPAAAAPAPRVVARPRRASRTLTREPLDPRTLGRLMAAAHGWTGAQWGCLDRLWQRESRWSVSARNSSSGAYGIPQALPAERLAAAGPGWRTDPAVQLRWGLGYIEHRYGTPCAAWAHSRADGFY